MRPECSDVDMAIKPVKLIVAGALCCTALLSLFGCGAGVIETDVRELPGRVSAELAKGDTREKVRALLGSPLIDAKQLRLEVYRDSGRDWFYLGIPVPPFVTLPMPEINGKVSSVALVRYDANQRVLDAEAGTWTPRKDFGISLGGFDLVNTFGEEPDTLLGPSIAWDELAQAATTEQSCTLFLTIGECVMKYVSIDHRRIAELAPDDTYCAVRQNNSLYGTFIRKELVPGTHRLRFHPGKRHSDFEAEFDCQGGEKVFAGLDADIAHDAGWGSHLVGSILIGTSPPKRFVEMGDVRPILHHLGTSYGWSERSREYSQ